MVDISKLQTLCFVYLSVNNLLPSSFINYFSLNSDIHEHFTRISKNIHLIQHRTLVREFSIKIHGPKIWNEVDFEVRNSRTIFAFKKIIKKNLLNAY